MLFSGQGKVYAAVRDANGNPGAFKFLGNVPELKIGLSTSTKEHKEATSGSRITDARMITENKATVSLTIEDFTADNLAIALYGTTATVTGSTVTDEVLPSGLVVGDYVRTAYPKISSVTFKDSTATPKIPTSTNIATASANHGLLQVKDITTGGAFVQPFKVSYTYGDYVNTTMFTQAPPERWLRFEGLNTADTNAPVLVELYRVFLDPMKEFGLIQDDFAKWQLDGSVLYDTTRAGTSGLGGFGRVIDL